jgi:hypothetical protein
MPFLLLLVVSASPPAFFLSLSADDAKLDGAAGSPLLADDDVPCGASLADEACLVLLLLPPACVLGFGDDESLPG